MAESHDPFRTSTSLPLHATLQDLKARAAACSAAELTSVALADMRERWLRGERVPAEAYLNPLPALQSNSESFLDFIHGEIQVRQEMGETPEVSEYVRRFPQHESALRRQFKLHRDPPAARAASGSSGAGSGAPMTRATAVSAVSAPGSRFQILRPHARGGLGEVFVAEDIELHRQVALKEIQNRHADNPISRARFLLEAEITGGLEHPGIVPVYGLGHYADGRPYYAMRFIKGDSLKEAIERFHKDKKGQDPGESAVEFRSLLSRFVDVCNAVAYAHSRGVLHRDLKPGNIMLGKYGETLVVDWGLAKPQGHTEFGLNDESLPLQPQSGGTAETIAGAAIGTPQFMSPEQAAGRLDRLGPASDVYSLGATLYALLTGQVPFTDREVAQVLRKVQQGAFPPPRQVQRGVPAALEAVCLKAMALQPEARYPTPRALADDVEHWLADETVSAFREPLTLRLGRWARRHRTRVTSAAAALVVAVIGLVIATVMLNAANDRERAAKQIAEGNEQEAKRQAEIAAQNEQEAQKQSAIARRNEDEARAQSARALRSEQEAKRQGDKALRLLAQSYLDRGVADWEAGRHPQGVFEIYQAYRMAPQGSSLRGSALRLLGDRCRRLEILLPHERSVNAVAFSPDGKTVLTGSADTTARLWDAATGKPLTPPLVHDEVVRTVAFSPDGKTVVTGASDQTARLWNTSTGKPIGSPLRHEGSVDVAVFSPDGTMVLTAGEDDTARLWSAVTGKPLSEPLRHNAGPGVQRGIHAAAFSPDSKTVLTGGSDGTARLWQVATGKSLGILRDREEPMAAVYAVAFSPDGKTIVTGSRDRRRTVARLWDSAGKLRETLVHEGILGERGVRTLAFSPDGKSVLTGGLDGTARLWDVASGKPLTPALHHEDAVIRVAFRSDGKAFLTCCRDGTIRLWDVATALPFGAPLRHERGVYAAFFSPDGKKVLTGSQDYTARLWDLATDQLAATRLPHQSTVNVAYSPDGKTVLTGSNDRTARLWDAATGKPLFEVRHRDTIFTVAYSPDSKMLLTGSWDGTVRVWSAATGQPLATLQHKGPVLAAVFSPDGKNILTGSEDKTAQLWEVSSGKPLTPPLQHDTFVRAVAFSPDGELAATASADMTARLWVVATGKLAIAPILHGITTKQTAAISAREGVVLESVAFSPDGKRLLTACTGTAARLWDVASGKSAAPPLRHDGAVALAVFSPDGKTALTGSADHTARLWDVATGQMLTAPLRHQNDVVAIAFGPDGKTVLTGSWDKTAQRWDAATGMPIGPPLRHDDRVTKRAVAFGPDGKTAVTGSIDKMGRIWHFEESTITDDQEQLAVLIAVRTKLQLTADGLIAPLGLADWHSERQKLENRSSALNP